MDNFDLALCKTSSQRYKVSFQISYTAAGKSFRKVIIIIMCDVYVCKIYIYTRDLLSILKITCKYIFPTRGSRGSAGSKIRRIIMLITIPKERPHPKNFGSTGDRLQFWQQPPRHSSCCHVSTPYITSSPLLMPPVFTSVLKYTIT